MSQVKYLTAAEVLHLNETAIATLGGGNAGVQSPRAFDVVITQPQQIVFGQEMYPTIWLKAAYMMQQIVKTPVFVDGSKRTAMLVVQTFLTANGYEPTPDFFEDVQAFTIEVTQTANTEAVMATIADWLASVFTERQSKSIK